MTDRLLIHARRLERERDELRSDLEFRRGLFQLQEQQLNNIRAERDEWKAKYIQQNKDLRCEMMDPTGTIWDHAKKLQDENKTLQEQLEFERELNKHKAVADAIGISEAVSESIKDRIDALQEQLNAALMLGKMQERRHERELAEARGMTAYLTHYDEIFRKYLCQKWEKWPHDPEPFESPDHDNDSETYKEKL